MNKNTTVLFKRHLRSKGFDLSTPHGKRLYKDLKKTHRHASVNGKAAVKEGMRAGL